MKELCLYIVMAPLAGAILAGFLGRVIGRAGAHAATILGVGVSFVLSCIAFQRIVLGGEAPLNENLYLWLATGGVQFHVGFLIDQLTVTMMVVVTFVSWMVHIYTIGYMHDDPGYQRFFAYISLFTFSMLMLVMSNNFMQLFFGWEAVGLVSYLLIGFWFKRDTAIFANLKAFLSTASATSAFCSASPPCSCTSARWITPKSSPRHRASRKPPLPSSKAIRCR